MRGDRNGLVIDSGPSVDSGMDCVHNRPYLEHAEASCAEWDYPVGIHLRALAVAGSLRVDWRDVREDYR